LFSDISVVGGLLLGFAGSLHCLGMCAPLNLLFPSKSISVTFVAGRLVYNLGRIITYAIMGIIFGFLGANLKIFGLQDTLSIIVGVLLILSAFITFGVQENINKYLGLNILYSKLIKLFGLFSKNTSLQSQFLVGLLNGLLPCGLVYAAIGAAITLSHPLESSLFMTFFGLGTFPAMFFSAFVLNKISTTARGKLIRVLPLVTVLFGVFFIMRGLNLDIPYISPALDKGISRMGDMDCVPQ